MGDLFGTTHGHVVTRDELTKKNMAIPPFLKMVIQGRKKG